MLIIYVNLIATGSHVFAIIKLIETCKKFSFVRNIPNITVTYMVRI